MANPNDPCFVCSESVAERRVRWFGVLYYWCLEAICRKCWDMETGEPKAGTWDEYAIPKGVTGN